MSENVFDIAQWGSQGGTFGAPGSPAAATVVVPVNAVVVPDLNRGSQYPRQDRGRNVRNTSGQGFNGIRAAAATATAEARFEDLPIFLEGVFAHASPTGTGPYTRVYPLEAGIPTLVPATWELGNTDAAQAQERLISALIDSITLSFADVTEGQASPLLVSAGLVALDRDINALTDSLEPLAGLETILGHRMHLYEGPIGTAFGSLSELSSSLKALTVTPARQLVRRAYGGDSDVASGFGFKDQTNGTGEAKIAISSTAKTDFHDVWNAASPASLGERRLRFKATGTGTKAFTLDLRAGIMAVPYDEADGERLFKVSFEFVDDDTLDAPAQITIVNSIASF